MKEDDALWSDDFDKKTLPVIKKSVVHYHGLKWTPNDITNHTMIINYRKDFFSQFCSRKIAYVTGQYTNYDQLKIFHQIRINVNEAVETVKSYYDYLENVRKMGRKRSWKSVVEIAYEDIISNYDYLFDAIPLQSEYDKDKSVWMQKSPYPVHLHVYNFEKTKQKVLSRLEKKYGIKL